MNKTKWGNPTIPITILALKLTEETGEVATEITDAFMDDDLHADKLLTELDHVIFIANVLRTRVTSGLAG